MLIIVQGGSASGKTWLSNKLANDLNIGVLAKDDIKELLFDKVGLPDSPEISMVYGKATMRAFYDILDELYKADAARDLIIESAFFTEYANKDFQDIREKYDVKMLQLFVTVEHEERRRRFESRPRHQGHLDDQRTDVISEEFLNKYQALQIERTITVDTTHFDDNDYQALVEEIKGELR
jgi:predicted kinase